MQRSVSFLSNSRFMTTMIRSLFVAVSLVWALPACAQHDEHADRGHRDSHAGMLGHVSFPNSGNAAAQKPFVVGLALLHSFEYEQAADSFRVAEKADPKFALAYWMDALTNTKLLWGLEDRPAAITALNRLGPTAESRLAFARTRGERAFGAAVEAFYREGEVKERVKAFADSMRSWTRRMPSDPEGHAFAALAILWEASDLSDEAADALKREAVQHAQFVFDRNPEHPGAAHYIIHASDAPAAAQRGLKAAREYSRIAPDAEHALHMPSHIFLPLGLWDDMVQSNERAWKASRADVASHNAPEWYNDWHSLNWLQYAYLQLGRWKDARALIDTARTLTRGARTIANPATDPDAMYVVEQLAFRYGAETGDWSVFPLDSVQISASDSTISDRARSMATASLYQRGTVAAMRGDTALAKSAAAVVGRFRPVMAQMIGVSLLAQRKDRNAMVAALEALAPQARVDRYSSMTPSPVINPKEMLGALLVESGRAREAVEVYRQALLDRPRRAASLLGLARAQDAAGDAAGARRTYDELSKMWEHADARVRAQLRSQPGR